MFLGVLQAFSSIFVLPCNRSFYQALTIDHAPRWTLRIGRIRLKFTRRFYLINLSTQNRQINKLSLHGFIGLFITPTDKAY